jgi:peptidoglycan/LPS O-acetylase OafA/YrhL
MTRPDVPGARLMANLGNFCVAVFMVLSGFLVFRPYVRSTIDGSRPQQTARYLMRRAARIYPAYWVAFIGYAVVHDGTTGRPLGNWTLMEPVLTDNALAGMGVSWTLTLEVCFYVFLPVFAVPVARFARRRSDPESRWRIAAAATAVLCVLGLSYSAVLPWIMDDTSRWGRALPAYLWWFGLGMLIAVLRESEAAGVRVWHGLSALSRNTAWCWFLAGVCYFSVVRSLGPQVNRLFVPESYGQVMVRFAFQGLAAFFLVLPVTSRDAYSSSRPVLASRPLVFLGSVSYGVYLWHQTIIHLVRDWFDPSRPVQAWLGICAVVVPVSVVIGWISYRVVERPALDLVR